ncbi:hypothetical protein Pmani_004284 [Petrolisthes manimaculis]|uniref:Uncharacterized protein n=1 Tax=Petrolisthes manimaculis TaxID=1843537 RepID=A0AAE1UNG5_9EUCA|nr:hypothetical protein Pmani_004284 [Petrolisthes manimaculis]
MADLGKSSDLQQRSSSLSSDKKLSRLDSNRLEVENKKREANQQEGDIVPQLVCASSPSPVPGPSNVNIDSDNREADKTTQTS